MAAQSVLLQTNFPHPSETTKKGKKNHFFNVLIRIKNCLNLGKISQTLETRKPRKTYPCWLGPHKISLYSLFVTITLSTSTSKNKIKSPLN